MCEQSTSLVCFQLIKDVAVIKTPGSVGISYGKTITMQLSYEIVNLLTPSSTTCTEFQQRIAFNRIVRRRRRKDNERRRMRLATGRERGGESLIQLIEVSYFGIIRWHSSSNGDEWRDDLRDNFIKTISRV